MLSLSCSPSPAFTISGDPSSAFERELLRASQHELSSAMLLLATKGLPEQLEPSLAWLRAWAQRFLSRLCQTRDPAQCELPSDLEAVIATLPLMLGAEYVTPALLTELWQSMSAQVPASDLEAWLAEHGSDWHLVGRVTFHLAENKRDSERPFAFLATFTENLSATGQLQHLPLRRALEQYAGQQDQAALNALLAPVRIAAERSALVKTLLDSRQLFQALAWTPAEAYRLVRELQLLRDCGIVVKVPDWWKAGKPSRAAVQVTIDAPEKSKLGANAMLSFSVTMSMDGDPLTPAEIAKIKEATSGLVSLRGQWVEVDQAQIAEMQKHWGRVQRMHADGAMSFHEGMRYLSGLEQGGASVQLDGFADTQVSWAEVVAGKGLHQMLDHLRDAPSESAPEGLHATLRPYQLRGYGWLHGMARLGLGACLADDMGLGKTVQVIALLAKTHLGATDKMKPSLVVAPASLMGNWLAEFQKFAPSLKVFIAHTSMHTRAGLEAAAYGAYDAVVTTYQELARNTALREHPWQLTILDEAQAIKNPGSQQTKAVKALQAQSRIALTGTPVENRPGDLWSLFDFLNPGLLGSAAGFGETVKRLGSNFSPLRKLVQPYLLRRMKTDKSIIPDLPDKTEMIAHCPLTRRQATIYQRLVEELKRTLNDPNIPPIQRQGQVLGFLMRFKQVCNHPSHWSGDGQFQPQDSGKFQRLAELCSEIAARQQRVLVFTQFAEMCAPLSQHLTQVFGRPGLVLNGSTPVKQRPELVKQFQSDAGPPFFVISVKAGGTGLTLTAASHVIHFDRWWNPAVENQATDRAYRIGQKRNVLVHKFVVPGTIEERIDKLMAEKSALANDLVGTSAGAEKLLTDMSAADLLRFVALDVNAVGD